ncbi:Dipeptidyl peptidase 1 [Amphibalanus amphitrite]|uniref:Dipeptidyl peptidase 1 n=1 Tax=Amphibalanus amphitrite TaxID=1232801 RepID=A0A6A4WD82_AMPAM|nr:Dipeptidyl peptidase 1 [Amphibalanus amphitrite]
MQTPIFRTEEPLWFLETAWCSQTQMGLSESTVWDLQSLMGARQMWTLGDAGMGPSEMPIRNQLQVLMPELLDDSLQRMVIFHMLKASPERWRERLASKNFKKVDDLVHDLTHLAAKWDVQGIVVSDTRMTGDLHIYNVYVSRATAEGDWGFLHQIESTNGHTVVAGDFNARSPVWCCSRAYNANGQALEAALQGLDSELISLLRPTRLAERYVDARWIEKQRALRRWRVDRRSSDEDTRVAARSVKNKTNALFKRAASTAYNECWDAYIDNANNNTTMFWRFVSTLDNDQPNTSGLHIEHNGTMLRTEEQRGEAFLGRFIDQCSQQDLRERQEARSELDAVISEATEPPTFTAEDLDEAIRRLSDTACGPDRLRAGDFRALTEVHRRSLLAEINTSVACGTIPAHWTDSFLVPIPKPGKDHRSLGGYRVITVQNIGGKLVESMIARKLSAALEAFLPPTLGAYRSGRATWLNVGQVVHKATEAFEAREHALIVGLDLQDAYNLVSVPILVRRLTSLGIDPFFVRWILQALQARRCALRSGRWLSDWTTVTMALPQGSPLSPVCFNAYTLPLATLPVPPNFTVYTFADDILLCGTGGCLPTVANQMQEVLDDDAARGGVTPPSRFLRMLRSAVFSLLLAAAAVRADTPANCSYSDIQGEWLFYSSEPTGDSSIQCDDVTPMDTVISLSLLAPNTVVDTFGNVGTWTLIYNQGFEATVNGRTYFAFSYYNQDAGELISYCDRTFPGWSHDVTVRNWACIRGQKQGPSLTKRHAIKTVDEQLAAKKYVNNHALIAAINARNESTFTARAYPQYEKYTVAEMYRRSGGARCVT